MNGIMSNWKAKLLIVLVKLMSLLEDQLLQLFYKNLFKKKLNGFILILVELALLERREQAMVQEY
jgi:hypothetical protein